MRSPCPLWDAISEFNNPDFVRGIRPVPAKLEGQRIPKVMTLALDHFTPMNAKNNRVRVVLRSLCVSSTTDSASRLPDPTSLLARGERCSWNRGTDSKPRRCPCLQSGHRLAGDPSEFRAGPSIRTLKLPRLVKWLLREEKLSEL